MNGYVESGDYYYVKIAHGAEMFLNASLNVTIGVSLTVVGFELAVAVAGSLSVTAGGKFEAGFHEFEFTGFKTRAEAKRLEALLSELKTKVDSVKSLVTENQAALEMADLAATEMEVSTSEAGAALSRSTAGVEALAAAGVDWAATVNHSEVDGDDTEGRGSHSALNASLMEAYGLEQRVAGQATRLRGSALNSNGASTALSVLRTSNGALTVM
ncbi:MAG: hypothetical protein LBP33_04995 [Candidatus Adiutrix sp.]|jgi:hypothetical protein|nr:hypothetical protein [Candidatus Adiutrix sp.]